MSNIQKTPTYKNKKSVQNSSGKKLVQARLPFKVITPTIAMPTTSSVITEQLKNLFDVKESNRKRKLSFISNEEDEQDIVEIIDDNNDDDNDDNDDNIKKAIGIEKDNKKNKNFFFAKITNKKLKTESNNSTNSNILLIVNDSNDLNEKKKNNDNKLPVVRQNDDVNLLSLETNETASTEKRKSAGRSQKNATKISNARHSGRSEQRHSGTVQIKISIPSRKKVKQQLSNDAEQKLNKQNESSDNLETILSEFNPKKRTKIDATAVCKRKEEITIINLDSDNSCENVCDNNESETTTKSEEIPSENLETQKIEVQKSENSENAVNAVNEQITVKIDNKKDVVTENTTVNDNNVQNNDKDKDIDNSIVDILSVSTESIASIENKKTDETPILTKTNDDVINLEVQNVASTVNKETATTFGTEYIIEVVDNNDADKDIDADKDKNEADKNDIINVDDVDDVDDDEISKSSSSLSISIETELNVTTEIETDQPTTTSTASAAIKKMLIDNFAKRINNNNEDKKLEKKNKIMTPKQMKLMEQRRKAREEKERKLQEEREQKQREKEQRELSKKREREEKEDQRRKEKEEKEEQRRKEKEEKERKKLAEIEQKNEEKRKRTEAKEEENRKKEEERKRKEQEKEEIELKKKKAAEAFTKFFVPKTNPATSIGDINKMHKTAIDNENITSDTEISLMAFRPFQIKGHMKLAPITRRVLTAKERMNFDLILKDLNIENTENIKEESLKEHLYLGALKLGKIIPGKCERTFIDDTKDDNDDEVCIVDDELERVAEHVEETQTSLERHRAKFFKFTENQRPAYYGTWRKKTEVIKPRRPFVQDQKFFDYEADSDLEWEEEEPGESLDGSEEEKESEEDEYEVDNEWFVPHGHLSEEEMQYDDELSFDDVNNREAKKVKLKILEQQFAKEMKKKTEKLKPLIIGCVWADENGNKPESCPQVIWDALNKRAMICRSIPVNVDSSEDEEDEEMTIDAVDTSPTSTIGTTTNEKLKPIILTEDMIKNLLCLVHGNRNSKIFLINEFIAFVEMNEHSIKNGEVRGPLKSTIREKIEEFAEWKVNEMQNKNKKGKIKKHLCWIVYDEILKKMNLEHLTLNNEWDYVLQPKVINSKNDNKIVEEKDALNSNELSDDSVINEQTNELAKTTTTPTTIPIKKTNLKETKAKRSLDMTKFTKVITAEEKFQKMSENTNITSTITTAAAASTQQIQTQNSVQPSTAVKKRVQLLLSVPIGQEISQPTKNALINKFLNKNKKSTTNEEQHLQKIVQENKDVTLIKSTTNTETIAKNDSKNISIYESNDNDEILNKTLIATKTEAQTKIAPVKKRVQLLMSVPIGQEIPTPTKNALINEFLNKNKKSAGDCENVQQNNETNNDVKITTTTTTTVAVTIKTNDNENVNFCKSSNKLENNSHNYNAELNAQNVTATMNDTTPTAIESTTTTIATATTTNEPVKKRVQLLMSVPIGQEIPVTTKNALINEFLNKNKIKLLETQTENIITNLLTKPTTTTPTTPTTNPTTPITTPTTTPKNTTTQI